MDAALETIEGYVVDIACLRKYALSTTHEQAQNHSKHCALMGHCIESGYGLVTNEGQVALLDATATPAVISALQASEGEKGIRLSVTRKLHGAEMQVVDVNNA